MSNLEYGLYLYDLEIVITLLMRFCLVRLTVGKEANPHQYFSRSLQNLYSLKRKEK